MKGARVGGKPVAELLGRECLTPNRVCLSPIFTLLLFTTQSTRTPFPNV